MLKPFIPIIADSLSHEFNEVAHVSTIHTKFGSHHLQKEMSDSSSEDENQSLLKSEDKVSFHVFENDCDLNFDINLIDSQFLLLPAPKIFAVVISKHIPPPKFS
jgi:hypothetical protein